ncbi:MAG: CaiB/BaiF CoA-transferase family protein [Acidimicrobiia bacterium]
MSGSPLAGYTVLDLASVGPAARTSRWLSDYGADVVKIGPTPKHGSAQVTPWFFAYSGHRGMRRAQLDLKEPAGRDAFLRLAADADVVIESFRPGVVDRLGIGYDDVREVNPGIVYCSTTGFGQHGPYSKYAGHDLGYLAIGGFLDCSGRGPDGAPAIPGATVADSAAGGMQAVMAILAALLHRTTTDEGAYLDVSVADGVVALMSLAVDEYLATGEVPGPRHGVLTGRYAWYGVYACADDKWLAVGVIEPHFFENLCRELGCDQWSGRQYDDAVQDEMRADFRAMFASRDRDSWVAQLAPADTCVAAVYTVPEVVEDPHFTARQVFVDAESEEHGRFRQAGWLFAGMERDQPTAQVRDQSVTDTGELLAAVGYTEDEIDELREKGVVA